MLLFLRNSIVATAVMMAGKFVAAENDDPRHLASLGVQNECGVLAFDSQDAFQNTIELLASEEDRAGTDALDKFELSLNFYSLRNYLVVLEEKKGELTPDEDHVHDDFLATLVNSDYKILIGSSGYVLTSDITYEYLGIDACTLQQDPSKYRVIKHVNDPDEKAGRNLRMLQGVTPCAWWRSCSAFTVYNNGNRRFKGKVWIQNYPFYATAGTSTKHYRRKSNGGWTRERADKIWCNAGIVVTDLNCILQGSGSFGDSRQNRKTVRETRSWWNQITRAHAMGSGHGAEDNGAACQRSLDLFNCNSATLNC